MSADDSQRQTEGPHVEPSKGMAPDGSLAISIFKDGNLCCDANWQITGANEQAELMLKQPRAELIGKVFWDAFPIVRGTEIERAYHRVAREKESFGYELHYHPRDLWFDVR